MYHIYIYITWTKYSHKGWRHKCARLRHYQNHQVFENINAIFDSYCSFCLFGSYVTNIFVLFHWSSWQKFWETKVLTNFVIWTYIQASGSCSIFGRDRTTQPSQKACNLYTFWNNILLAITSFLQNTRNCFCFWEISLSGIPQFLLICAEFFQQKLEGLWQQTIFQQTLFDKFDQLTKFHDQDQTGAIED